MEPTDGGSMAAPDASRALDGGEADAAVIAFGRRIGVGWFHSCAVLDSGAVKCWGSNARGQLGLGDTTSRGDGPGEMGSALPAVDLGAGRFALEIAASYAHTCALLDDHQVKCWGENDDGQLGLGDVVTRGDQPGQMGDALPAVDLGSGRTALAITAGFHHTCALLDDHQIKCWGFNGGGNLGLGDEEERGDEPGEMGDSLPTIDLGAGRSALAIAAGFAHTCALLDDHQVKCWGLNVRAVLGLGNSRDHGRASDQMGDSLPAVSLGTGRTAVAISAMSDSGTCAVLDDGALKCWGLGRYGTLGQGEERLVGDQPGEMGDGLPAIDLGEGRGATAVSVGWHTTCAILDDGHIKCWGMNNTGQLGQGDFDDRGDEPGEMGDALPSIELFADRAAVEVAVFIQHTCARLVDGNVTCWGTNFEGELGLGDYDGRGDAPGEMGDSLPPIEL